MAEKIENPEMGDKPWNVVTGCDKYSDGCLNCWAEDTAKWLGRMGQKVYRDNGFKLTLRKDKLDWPLRKLSKKPKRPSRCYCWREYLSGVSAASWVLAFVGYSLSWCRVMTTGLTI